MLGRLDGLGAGAWAGMPMPQHLGEPPKATLQAHGQGCPCHDGAGAMGRSVRATIMGEPPVPRYGQQILVVVEGVGG